MTQLKRIGGQILVPLKAWRDLAARERTTLVKELSQVSGLMPLLMKRRNRQSWTDADRAEIAEHLKRLSYLSPYVAVLVLPGGLLFLPALAWWLDRRRGGPRAGASPQR